MGTLTVATSQSRILAGASLKGRLAMPHRIAVVRPPYDRVERFTDSSAVGSVAPSPGTVLGVMVTEAAEELQTLHAVIPHIRARAPGCAVVMMVRTDLQNFLSVVSQAVRSGIRGVVNPDLPLRSQLRESLTMDRSISEDLIEWLDLRGVRLSPQVASLIGQIIRLAPATASLTELLAEIGVPETSARFRMQKKRLPAPSRWYQSARALHASLRIQAQTGTCLLRLAHDLGYADHSALSQLVYRSFGVRPAVIRGTLGWEWLMERWVAGQKIRTYRDPSAVGSPV